MNIKEFNTSLDYIFKAQAAAFVWGHSGVGKSSTIEQYAKQKGWAFFPLFLGTQADMGDVLGLQEFIQNESGETIGVRHLPPEWLVNIIAFCNNNPDKGGIIFLDEFNRGHKDLMQGMFSLALNKTLHTVKLPSNCHVIAAGNPNIDGYTVNDVDDTALMSRFIHVKFQPTQEEFFDYARTRGMDPSLTGFFREQPKLLFGDRGDFNLPVKIDPRAADRLSSLMKLNPPDNILEQLMFGILGVEMTVAYQEYKKKAEKPLTGEDVLSGNRMDLVKEWSKDGDIKASMLSVTFDNLMECLVGKNSKEEKLSEVEVQNLVAFIQVLPKEVAYANVIAMISKDIEIINVPFCDHKISDTILESIRSTITSSVGKA